MGKPGNIYTLYQALPTWAAPSLPFKSNRPKPCPMYFHRHIAASERDPRTACFVLLSIIQARSPRSTIHDTSVVYLRQEAPCYRSRMPCHYSRYGGRPRHVGTYRTHDCCARPPHLRLQAIPVRSRPQSIRAPWVPHDNLAYLAGFDHSQQYITAHGRSLTTPAAFL